jgi:hypothetical protein
MPQGYSIRSLVAAQTAHDPDVAIAAQCRRGATKRMSENETRATPKAILCMGLAVSFLDVGVYGPVDRLEVATVSIS